MRNPYGTRSMFDSPFELGLPEVEATFKVRDDGRAKMTYEFTAKEFEAMLNRWKAPNAMKAERVIFNPPATIVIWKDGTKTVVKAQDDRYDRMTGVALCYMKKALGNTSRAFNDALKAAREDGHND